MLIVLTAVLQACATSKAPPQELLSLSEAQLKIRSYQTRVFDCGDQDMVLRAVVASLQDLDFIVERANAPLGLVTAGKFGPGGSGIVELTVTVRPKSAQQTEVRLNAIYNTKPVDDPKVYQNFFTVLERTLFIAKG